MCQMDNKLEGFGILRLQQPLSKPVFERQLIVEDRIKVCDQQELKKSSLALHLVSELRYQDSHVKVWKFLFES